MPARAQHGHHGQSRRGGAGGQGSLAVPMQHGRQREYEDGEGRSPGKKDGGTAHQGGSGPMRWRMGRCGGISSRAVA
jgi:hypothetical protein